MSVIMLGWKRKSGIDQDGQGSHHQADGASIEPSKPIGFRFELAGDSHLAR